MRRWLVVLPLVTLVTGVGVRAACADEEWPVRLNVSMPIGYTFGSERLHGFTWGFRGSANVFPAGRELAVGGYAEMLLDTRTHSLSSYGASMSYPVKSYKLESNWAMDWRLGGYGGVRYSGEGTDHDTRLATGVFTELAVPAYLYEFRIGLHIDGTFSGGLSATTIVLDLDLALLVALAARGAGGS